MSKRVHQPTQQSHTVFVPRPTVSSAVQLVHAQNERLAHEQFIEQNAWARPQAPIPTHPTPNLTHTDNWAEPSAANHTSTRSLMRNLSSGNLHRVHNDSPYTTPMPQRRTQPPPELSSSSGTVAVNSDGASEPPSSVLVAPPTTDRTPYTSLNPPGHLNAQASPLHVTKQRQPNVAEREVAGFRNASNMSTASGASTIDMPQGHAYAGDRDRQHVSQYSHYQQQQPKTLPALLSETSAPQQVFDTSQLHRRVDVAGERDQERRDVYASGSFRPQEGAFGTPVSVPWATGSGPAA